jgi:hypothetical protein
VIHWNDVGNGFETGTWERRLGKQREVAMAEVALEAAEIAGIVVCTVSICVMLASYYNRKQYARKNTPAPAGGLAGVESAVEMTSACGT